VGELVFRNYYTAWITLLARFSAGNNVLLMQGHTNMSYDAGALQGKIFVPTNKGTGSSMKLTEQVGDWVVAIPRRVLMPSPHLENGSHDFISISATEVIFQFVLKLMVSEQKYHTHTHTHTH
jgi:hypothetical protein